MKEINADSFEETITQSRGVVVDFWAPWCGPCRALAPILAQIEEEVASEIVVAKVNVDECQELAERFDVQSIPTIIFFKNGKEVNRTVGMKTKVDILSIIDSL
ncbi:MAG: thioredoxin [Puniceicoccales bacterium]|jgi:thioredoxin 1|nr:thioredoxin [Puniceicoccales bacterium]